MSDTERRRKKGSRKIRMWMRILIILLIIVLAVVGVIIAFRYATYNYAKVIERAEGKSLGDVNYTPYINGLLEYGRDGIAMLSEDGEEIWNQPCQIANPIAAICKNAAAVADKGGTGIYVFQRSGLKGEIQTTRPIEKIAVSSQGIVAAILQDEETPLVMCYDAKGNVLVQQKTSLKSTGYPVDLALSQDGNMLLVSYLCTNGSGVSTKVCYYDFGEAGQAKEDHVVTEAEYKDTIAPTVAFLNDKTSVIVMDYALAFYKGTQEPQEYKVIKFKSEIHSVAYDEKYVAVVLREQAGSGYTLQLYRTNGKLVMSADYEGEYANLRVEDDMVFLYESNRCQIYNNIGVCKFRGTLELGIQNIFPAGGIHKYKVINADGFHEIQLAR